MTTSAALTVAPRSRTTRPTNSSSACSSTGRLRGVVVMVRLLVVWSAVGTTLRRAGLVHRQPIVKGRDHRCARAYARRMLRLWVCGRLAAELDGEPVGVPSGDRARALLGWLALHPGTHPRAALAARLWPDVPEASARASLRTAV